MKKLHPLHHLLLALPLLLGQVPAVQAQVSVGIGINLPGVDIGINLPAYPQLERVPGYPVYYAPGVSSNYFFYDGLYWVYQNDGWYSSDWYDGPWGQVQRAYVPLFVLRVPVRYYRQPPAYFRGWRPDAPPRWGDHWGRDWSDRHRGWDRWDRRMAPAPAPLPVYQRNYIGDRYPRAPEQQRAVRAENYRYKPRETVSRQVYRPPTAPMRSEPRSSPQRPAPSQRPSPSREAQRPGAEQLQQRPQIQPPRPAQRAEPPARPQPQRPQERPQQRAQPIERPMQAPRGQSEAPRPPQAQPAQRQPQGRGEGPRGRGEPMQRDPAVRGAPPQERGRDRKGD